MTGPPFDPYPASAVSVRERAYDLVDRADELPPIVDAVGQAAGVAQSAVSGPNPHTLRALVDHGVLRDLLDSMPVDPDTLGVHGGYCDPQGYSSCGYRYGDDPGFWATAKDIGSMPWKIGEAGANWLYLDDARAALAGDKAAMAWLALDAAAGPLGRAIGMLRHSDEALEALHNAENAEDALDAAEDASTIGHAGRHQFPGTLPRKSQFYDDVDLVDLSKTDAIVGFPQPNGNTRFVMWADYGVGVDRTTGSPTEVYTVIRGPDGQVVTMFPGTSPRS